MVRTYVAGLLLFASLMLCSCDTKESGPAVWSQMSIVYLKGITRTETPHNSLSRVFGELGEPRIRQRIADWAGCSQTEFHSITLVMDRRQSAIELYLTDGSSEAFDAFCEAIRKYAALRLDGHSPDYIASMMDLDRNRHIADIDLQNLISLYPDLPSRWLKKIGSRSNMGDGEELQIVDFVLIDGAIAWAYSLYYESDGTFKKGWPPLKYDAKEYDDKYTAIMGRISQKVNDRMERDGIKGLGSCHTAWRLKKDYLKQEAIDWKSPFELNPGTLFD